MVYARILVCLDVFLILKNSCLVSSISFLPCMKWGSNLKIKFFVT